MKLEWEHPRPTVWQLFEGPRTGFKRPRLALATVHKREPGLGEPLRDWYQIFGDTVEYNSLAEAKRAAVASVRKQGPPEEPR
jgi:hypothetical protein